MMSRLEIGYRGVRHLERDVTDSETLGFGELSGDCLRSAEVVAAAEELWSPPTGGRRRKSLRSTMRLALASRFFKPSPLACPRGLSGVEPGVPAVPSRAPRPGNAPSLPPRSRSGGRLLERMGETWRPEM